MSLDSSYLIHDVVLGEQIIIHPTPENIELYKSSLPWGTYGKKGDLKRKTVFLHERFTSHLLRILELQGDRIPFFYKVCINQLLLDRLENVAKRLKVDISQTLEYSSLCGNQDWSVENFRGLKEFILVNAARLNRKVSRCMK